MTLSRQQIIDEEVQRIFESSLPPDWIIRKRLPDYRIDYVVEIFEHGESTGLEFAVQLKGTRRPRLIEDTARFSVESPHLGYWMDKMRHPVFLVLIDVQEKKGWWVFIQGLIRDGAIRKMWRQQKSVTLPLPLTNLLESTAGFRQAIEDASSHMMSVWPGSIRPAIQSEKARLESLDPRFNVRVNATETSTHFRMEAKEDVPVSITFRFQPEDGQVKIDDLVARGLPVELDNVRVEASGSDLWAEAASKPSKIQFQVEKDCEARFRVADSSVVLDPLRGKIRGGTRDWRFSGHLGDGLFTFATDVLRPPDGQPMLNCEWNLDLSKFDDKPLLELPYFDQLHNQGKRTLSHC